MRFAVRVHVGHEGRARNLLLLRRQRRGEREDVCHNHVGRRLAHQRQRLARGVHHRLVEVKRLGSGGKHLILGGGGKRQALALYVRAPARPRLQRDLMAARGQRSAEGDHRKRVAGIAEGA